MNIFILPPDIQFSIVNKLNMPEQVALGRTCKFFKTLVFDATHPNPTKRFSPTDLKVANKAFFIKFFDLFTLDYLLQFDFKRITREELKALDDVTKPKKAKMAKVTKLIQSIRVCEEIWLEEFNGIPLNSQTELKDQKGYFYFFLNHHFLYRQVFLDDINGNECGSIEEGKNLKDLFLSEYENEEIKQKRRCEEDPNNTLSFVQACAVPLMVCDDMGLQIADYDLAVKTYTEILKQYTIKQLDNKRTIYTAPGNVYTCMTAPMFQGLCNSIMMHNDPFLSFKSWHLTENNLQAWNKAFENRQIKELTVCLESDVTLTTIKTFAGIILKLDATAFVNVEYLIIDENSQKETKELFLSYEPQILSKNQNWRWDVSIP